MASQLIANLEACASRDDLGDICQAIEEAPSFDQLALAQLAIASGEAEVTDSDAERRESESQGEAEAEEAHDGGVVSR